MKTPTAIIFFLSLAHIELKMVVNFLHTSEYSPLKAGRSNNFWSTPYIPRALIKASLILPPTSFALTSVSTEEVWLIGTMSLFVDNRCCSSLLSAAEEGGEGEELSEFDLYRMIFSDL